MRIEMIKDAIMILVRINRGFLCMEEHNERIYRGIRDCDVEL